MKKLLLSFTLFIGIALCSKAQSDVIVENPNKAEISFKTEIIDYGNIEQGVNGLREFEFTNTGNEPLVISDAVGSCGCTIATWPKYPIKPGEGSTIKVKYDTKRLGSFQKSVKIMSNARTATKVLRIKGTVLTQAGIEKENSMPATSAN